MRKVCVLFLLGILLPVMAKADSGEDLFYILRNKIAQVKDYTADVRMKIDVSYMRIPILKGTLIFKAPDKMRLERKGGISLLPKKNINLTISNLIPAGKVTIIDLGKTTLSGKTLRVLKVVPEDDAGNIVITKIWVDEERMVTVRAETTTRNDGTVIMNLDFGRYTSYALPDKVTIFMDLKDYKLPKGVTMDYNNVETPETEAKKTNAQKGTIQISYLKYDINQGIADARFSGG